jgi:phosphoglycolate phosphatase-like HAD superfamily hydrolase
MAQTLASRLKRAASTERDIAETFQKMLPDTIGMTPAQMPAEPRQTLESLSARHAEVTRETGRLEDEIARLFDRTALTRYGDVARDMDAFKTGDAMTALGNMVSQNVGVQTIDNARYWSDQFDRWAARLGQQDQSKSAAGGNSGGKPDPAQMQALLALMRLRQQQAQLREQTSALDEQKQNGADYPSGARDAAGQQSTLRDQVRGLARDPSFPLPPDQLNPVGKAMSDAAGLLGKPETGPPTYSAQTDAINLLDSAIAQQAQKTGQNASALMAMMGMGMGSGQGGQGGKGSTAGGGTDKPNVPVPGSREGQAPDARAVIQAGGVDHSQLPGEFRDAIEGYHRAIEQSPQP